MFYKVIAGGKAYYSKDIIKQYYHCGDDLQPKIMNGTLTADVILDRIVYAPASAKEAANMDKIYSPVVQDLDKLIKEFVKIGSGANNLTCVGFDPKEPSYEYGSFSFIKFTAVASKSKYRDQPHLPVLEVCGTKYVALGCVKRGETYYIG